ncbi:MAG: hypothetical protein R6U56_09750 [Opitutales bacterium]
MLARLRILIVLCALCGAAHTLAGEELRSDLENGIALITSRKGEVTLAPPGARPSEAELHKVVPLTGFEVNSGSGEHIFFALSNGVGLGVYEDSRVRFVSYQQRPYTAGKESLDYEPSRSSLVIELREGSLSFAAEYLSPLSEVVIKLPRGQVRIHQASGRVLYNESGAHISITSGIVSYDYPNTTEEEFINGPNRVRISDQSAVRGRVDESSKIASDASGELTQHLVAATRHASERVLFRVSPEEPASIPQPVLVAKPESLQEASPRPYRYLD